MRRGVALGGGNEGPPPPIPIHPGLDVDEEAPLMKGRSSRRLLRGFELCRNGPCQLLAMSLLVMVVTLYILHGDRPTSMANLELADRKGGGGQHQEGGGAIDSKVLPPIQSRQEVRDEVGDR